MLVLVSVCASCFVLVMVGCSIGSLWCLCWLVFACVCCCWLVFIVVVVFVFSVDGCACVAG